MDRTFRFLFPFLLTEQQRLAAEQLFMSDEWDNNVNLITDTYSIYSINRQQRLQKSYPFIVSEKKMSFAVLPQLRIFLALFSIAVFPEAPSPTKTDAGISSTRLNTWNVCEQPSISSLIPDWDSTRKANQ